MGQKLIDETGNKYGKLTVLSLTKDKNNRTAWLCQCECGNTTIARGPDLRKNKITSCGCAKGKHPNNIKDISDQKFGMLTALQYEYSKNNKQYWSFQCDCGNICIKQKSSVLAKHTSSCGCASTNLNSIHNRIYGEVGAIFGLQQIIENKSFQDDRGRTLVKCKCIRCGRERITDLVQLKYYQKASCICVNSYPEYEIEQWLINNGIEFKNQYTFDDLATDINNYKTRLRFDFAIFKNHKLLGLIEYNGQQHYRQWDYDNSIKDLEERQARDKMKIDYCKQFNIPLLILTKDSNKEEELSNFIKTFNE